MHVSESRLISLALAALEEVAATCRYTRAPRSAPLRLVLAYLASRGRAERAPYDAFWRAVGHERPQERWGQANAALNGIYLAVGLRRDTAVVSRYEQAARKRWVEDGRGDACD